MKTVNQKGLEYIAEWLRKKARGGEDKTFNLEAWAGEVEQHVLDGNGAYFELRSFETASGHAEICTLTDDMLDGTDEVCEEDA